MRKIFTRLISIFILSSVIVLQGFAQTFPVLGPSSDFTNHKKTDTFVLTASVAVEPGVGVIRLLDNGGATLAAYQATNSNVSIAEQADGTYNISVDFTSLLEEQMNYTLDVDANFVKAVEDGTPNNAQSWAVSVGDYTPPVLAETDPLSPANGQTEGVQLDQALTVTFSEGIHVVDGSQVYIYTDNGTEHGDLFDVVSASLPKSATIMPSSGLYADGNVLTIVPSKNFEELTKYYVVIPSGVVVDNSVNENPFAGWLDNTSWVFTTRDATAPEITDIMADNIAKDAFDVVLQLDKPGKVYVLAVPKESETTFSEVITNGVSKEVTAASTDVTVSLSQYWNGSSLADMAESNTYDVYVVTENAETIAPTQSDATKELTVTTADVTKPTVVAMYPADGETAADINDEDYMAMAFTEPVKLGTGSVDVYTWNADLNHELLVSVPVSSCMVSKLADVTENDSLYIPVDKSLWVSEATYFVKYNEGIVTDVAGNKLAAVNTTEAWKFTVQDFLPPTYTIVPADGTRNASEVAPQVTITFDEPVFNSEGVAYDATTIMNVIDIKKGTTSVSYTVTSFTDNIVKLNLGTVASKDTFFVTINNKQIYDASGNAGTQEDVVEFSIRDYQGPTVTIEPLDPGKSDNILIKFNEPVFNADGSAITDADVANMVIFRKGTSSSGAIVGATYSVAADAMSFVIDPTNDFTTPGDQYYVRLGAGAVEDAAGNPNALAEATLTIADFIPPTATFSITSTDPVSTASAVEFTFSEAMQTLDGSAVSGDATALVSLTENGVIVPYTATWDITNVDAPKIVVSVTGGLKAGKTYVVSIGKSLQDTSENPFAGTSATFSTWSDVAPAMVSVTPAEDAIQQANDAAITVTFDQNIIAGTGTVSVVGSPSGTDYVSGTSIDGATLTIEHSNFVENETVTVTVPAGYVTNNNGDGNEVVTWSFMTKDNVKPTVDVYSPADNASDVAIDSKLSLTFSEDIVLKTGQILIKDASNDVTVQSLTEANAEVKDGNMLEITPVADFDYGKEYYVIITDGIVEDAVGNAYVGITDPATWSFTVALTPGEFMVASSNPADLEDMVAAGINPVTFKFNRAIKAGSLSGTAMITITNVTDGVVVLQDVANSGRFSISDSTLSINTLQDIVADKEYTVALEAGVVTDEWDTDNTASTITFYTYDNYGPKVVSTTPMEDATDVSVNTTVVVTWDEAPLMGGTAISAADIKNNSLVTIDGGVGTAYTASVNGLVWTLTLDAPLAEKTDYTVNVKQTAVEDALGNTQTSDYSWSFTTEDTTAPTISAFTVTDNTLGTEIKFTVDLDEAGMLYYMVAPADATAPTAADIMAANSIEFTGAGTSAKQTVSDLMSGADYTVYLVAVDKSDNQSSVEPKDFTTVDVIAPTILSMVPANGAVDVAADVELVLNFDEPVNVGTNGHILVREKATDILVEAIVLDGNSETGNTMLSNGDSTATITRGVTLASKTEYYVEVSAGAFVDKSNNPMAGISGTSSWAFTTKDTEKPLLVKTTPDYEATTTPEITAGTTLSMEFDEAMKVGAGVVYVKYESNDEVFDVINADALTLSGDMKTISFGLNNVPAEQTEFYIDLTSIALSDTSDNAWDNILNGETNDWNFIILDQTPPALLSSVPEDGATGVAIDQDIVLTFTEAIYQSPDATDFNGTDAYIGDEIMVKDESGTTVELDTVLISADRTEVTITPKSDLTSETMYTVYVSPVVDNRKNVSDEISISFTTADMTAPYVTQWDPAYMTMFNPKTGVVTVTFSEPIFDDVVTTSEGNTVVVDVMDENIPDFFNYNMVTDTTQNADGTLDTYTKGDAVAFTGTISEDKMVITLTPVADAVPLASQEGYVVELLPGVVEDAAGNTNAADFDIFGIEDYESPNATAYTPTGATMADDEMTITFDEAVAIGSGNIYVRNYDNGEVVQVIGVADTTVSVDGDVATIKHDSFPEAMNFYVTADAGTFVDTSANANPWEGIAQEDIDTWKFSTADAVAPGVIAEGGLFPAPGSTNVPMNTAIEITFDKQIQLNTDGETRWVVIYNEDWTPYQVIEVNSSNIDLKPVTDPYYETSRVFSVIHMNLQPNSTYYVRVMAGSVVDAAGNSFAGIDDDSWSFTTEDNQAPTIVSLTPADDSTGVAVNTNLTIEFDRGVMGNGAGMIGLYMEQPGVEIGTLVESIDPTSDAVTIDGNVATITLSQTLEANTGYYVIVEPGSFTNLSSNRLPLDPGITTTQGWNFTTGEPIVLPELTEWTPQDTIADNHPTFVMTFADDVMLAADSVGYLTVTEKDSASATLSIEITADMISGNVVTVEYDTLVGRLKVNTTYVVNVDGGILENADGNTFEGVSSDTTWTFTTGPDFATAVQPPVTETVDFKVYPNPFNNRIMIDNNDKLTRVVVLNIAGQKVIDREYPEHTISTSNLVSGVYVISMFTEDGLVKTERMVKR